MLQGAVFTWVTKLAEMGWEAAYSLLLVLSEKES